MAELNENFKEILNLPNKAITVSNESTDQTPLVNVIFGSKMKKLI